MRRILYLTFGWIAVGLGLIGVVLPGLPTTPFMLVAAFAFSKGSPRLRAWLVDHRLFGPPIRDWENRGAISRRAKVTAVSMMALIFAISLMLALPGWALLAQASCLAAVAIFILTRPD
ncbi:MAG: DUF454 domain-containing protein [Rhodobacteraceae bacterium]|nr:DUF454 domain-containing protein [Paracoccaceae bacterium]